MSSPRVDDIPQVLEVKIRDAVNLLQFKTNLLRQRVPVLAAKGNRMTDAEVEEGYTILARIGAFEEAIRIIRKAQEEAA